MSTSEAPRLPFVICVHVGAGYHAPGPKEKKYRYCMEDACREAAKILEAGGTALEAVVAAISYLEDYPLTNAGVGSNLNLEGYIELDASVMRGRDKSFAGLGAVRGVKNPCQVAGWMLLEERKGLLPLGRIRPIFLCGEGARLWASRQGFKVARPDELDGFLTTKSTRAMWEKYSLQIRQVDEYLREQEEKERRKSESRNKRRANQGAKMERDDDGPTPMPEDEFQIPVEAPATVPRDVPASEPVGETTENVDPMELPLETVATAHKDSDQDEEDLTTQVPKSGPLQWLFLGCLPSAPAPVPKRKRSSSPHISTDTSIGNTSPKGAPEVKLSEPPIVAAHKPSQTLLPPSSEVTPKIQQSLPPKVPVAPTHHSMPRSSVMMRGERMQRSDNDVKDKPKSETKLAESSSVTREERRYDTVGAVCIDSNGDIAAGVSSGGIAMKSAGRVGEAALYGSGCWAQNPESGNVGMGSSTTGTGEHIMKTMLASECARVMQEWEHPDEAIRFLLEDRFFSQPRSERRDDSPIYHIPRLSPGLEENTAAGILALHMPKKGGPVDIVWGHTTPSMAIGYMTSKMRSPKTTISRLADPDAVDTCAVSGVRVHPFKS